MGGLENYGEKKSFMSGVQENTSCTTDVSTRMFRN